MTMPSLTPDAVQMLNWMASYKDAGTSAGVQLHGPGGLLATPGLNKQIMNAMIMPRGLSGRLQVRPSVDTNEVFAILTGLLASSGSEPTGACADWPVVGQFKTCKQQHPFGQQGRMSQVLNVKYAGQIVNRGEFTDNVLFGKPDTGDATLPGQVNWTRALQVEHEKKLAELYLGYYRDYARYLYTGNPANTAGSQGFQQYRGLDLLINTNKADAVTGVLCPAADSVVVSFNNANVSTSGGTIYNLVSNVVTNLERLSEQLGLETKWAIVGRYGAFWAMTQVWPCVYATVGCPGTTNLQVRTASMEEQTDMRDKMRAGRYLPIEGKNYEFIIDDSIAETVAAGGVVGTYQSDLYFVPLTANGEPMLFWEYFPMLNAQALAAVNAMTPGGYYESVQSGRFLLVKLSPTHTCVQIEIIERPRLILLAPFLAARFTNMRYTISIHERDAFPNDVYFTDGGSTTTPLAYWYPQSGSNG